MAELEALFPGRFTGPCAEQTEEEYAAAEQTYRRLKKMKAASKRTRVRDSFLDKVGKRYRFCTVANWTARTDDDRKAKASVGAYADNMAAELKAGSGVCLLGPIGTGKDHLLVGLARMAIMQHDIKPLWINGLDLFGKFRDAIGTDITEDDMLRRYIDADLLILSDPVQIAGELSQHQAGMLFRIIDARNRDLRPTWVTLNVASHAEAVARMGAPIVDRLRHDALVIEFTGKSNRTKKGT